MKGTVFDIQRFSVHDGPGIRTTVFMKGCPLRCRWCHNPEGLSMRPQLQFFEEKCLSCGRCKNREHLSDALQCPTEALKICGNEMETAEVVSEILKDRAFYSDNGGVTFSGGECLLQSDFVISVLGEVKSLGIHCAIDTCGYVPWKNIESSLEVCDLYLYDVKCVSPSLHKKYTGVGNELIIDNLRRLSDTDKDIWIRVPVIPDFNNTAEEITAIAELISSLPSVVQVTLMPYHTLGASKYKTLGLEYPYDTHKKISEDELTSFKKIFIDRGISVV